MVRRMLSGYVVVRRQYPNVGLTFSSQIIISKVTLNPSCSDRVQLNSALVVASASSSRTVYSLYLKSWDVFRVSGTIVFGSAAFAVPFTRGKGDCIPNIRRSDATYNECSLI